MEVDTPQRRQFEKPTPEDLACGDGDQEVWPDLAAKHLEELASANIGRSKEGNSYNRRAVEKSPSLNAGRTISAQTSPDRDAQMESSAAGR